jgi:NAD(P)-dependent dehydrogenase (short-subunit alcohol dehydrogenase family)
VSVADGVEAVARRTLERFGRIDAWVNAASVTMFGAFLDVPLEDIRRVLEINVMGCVHGCRVALPPMIEQRSGVVVNIASILGVVAQPLGSAYTMSKFAIRGLGTCLRQELRLAGARGVHVCTVLPAAIDTPIFSDAANRSSSNTCSRPRWPNG